MMNEYLKGSSTRLVLFVIVFSCIVLAFTGIILNRDLTGLALVIAALLTPVSIQKGIQKKYERNDDQL